MSGLCSAHKEYEKGCIQCETKVNVSASGSNELLCVTRYTSVSCGVSPSKNGDLLRLDDIVKALEFVTDDDLCVHGRLRDLLENLET